MSDYIKREAAIAAAFSANAIGNSAFRDVCDTVKRIRMIPAEDVVERKHGSWWKTEDELGEAWMCSECLEEFFSEDPDFPRGVNYCPNCGSRMDGAE